MNQYQNPNSSSNNNSYPTLIACKVRSRESCGSNSGGIGAQPYSAYLAPSTRTIYLVTATDNTVLTLVDMLGQVVLKTSIATAGNHTIDVSSLTSGTYVLLGTDVQSIHKQSIIIE
jgi:Secretion system C-terminal sorting domain